MSGYRSRTKETTTSTSASVITLAGAALGYRAFATKHAIGETRIEAIVDDGLGNWVEGEWTLTDASTLTRTLLIGSSNADADLTFSAGTKSVFESISGTALRRIPQISTTAFALAVPLSQVGATYMPQQTVSSVLAFTVAASPVQGALVYVRLIADGTNSPTFTGMKEWGGSLGYDNRNGIANQVQFFYDGVDYFYSISQAVGAVAVDNIVPTAPSAAVANATPTVVNITMSEAMDPAYVPAASAFTVSGHTVSSVAVSGSTINLTCSAAFVNGEAARTAAYTQPGTNNARDLAGNLLANFTGLAITNNVGAVVTAPATMAAPVATAGSVSASLAFTAPANGGAAITGYSVTPYIGATAQTVQTFGAVASPIVATSLTAGTAYTFTIAATNSAGTGAASPASNSVTPTAAVAYPRLTPKDANLVESGSGPYGYVNTGTVLDSNRGVLNQALQSGVDGSFTVTPASAGGLLVGLQTTASLTNYSGMVLYVYGATYTGGGTASTVINSMAAQAGDLVKLQRVGSVVSAMVARAGSPTVFTEAIRWAGISTGILYFEVESSGTAISALTTSGLA